MKSPKLPFTIPSAFAILIIFTLGSGTVSTAYHTPEQDNGVVQCQIDGADWISGPPGHPELEFEEEAITDGRTMVRIEAFAADGSHLALTIFNTSGIGPGTYAITDMGMSGFYKKDFVEGDGYVTNGMKDNPGFITITEMTTDKVAGTFAFALRNAGDPDEIKQVTGGSFDVKFTKY